MANVKAEAIVWDGVNLDTIRTLKVDAWTIRDVTLDEPGGHPAGITLNVEDDVFGDVYSINVSAEAMAQALLDITRTSAYDLKEAKSRGEGY